MSGKVRIPQFKYNYALVGLALNLCPNKVQLTPTERLVLMDILKRLPFSSDGQVVDLYKCAAWQINRIQIATAVGVTVRTVSRAVAKLESLGLLVVTRRRDEDGLNQANSYVPVVSRFVEFAVTADDTSAEEAAAVAAALSGMPGDTPGLDPTTDVPLTRDRTDTTAPKGYSTVKTTKAGMGPTEQDSAEAAHSSDFNRDDFPGELLESERLSEQTVAFAEAPVCQSSSSRPQSKGFHVPSKNELWSKLQSQ